MAGGAGKVEDEALARQARSLQQSKNGPPAQAARAKGRRAPAAAGESPTRVPETGARGLLSLIKSHAGSFRWGVQSIQASPRDSVNEHKRPVFMP